MAAIETDSQNPMPNCMQNSISQQELTQHLTEWDGTGDLPQAIIEGVIRARIRHEDELRSMGYDRIEYINDPLIKIFGVGGCGVKSVQHMINSGIVGVQYVCADTDLQELNKSSGSEKLLLGEKLVKGLGTNGNTEIGREAALESINEIRAAIGDANMVFVVAGLGGGTGTGAAPVIAQAAKEREALTVGVVTTSLSSEGSECTRTAEASLDNLKAVVDSLIFIPNDKTMTFSSMYYAIRCITDTIKVVGLVGLCFADLHHVLSNSGLAFMGTGVASGKNRAREATQQAITALNNNISNFNDNFKLKNSICYIYTITTNGDITSDEMNYIGQTISDLVHKEANYIFQIVYDDNFGIDLRLNIVAANLAIERAISYCKQSETFTFSPEDFEEPSFIRQHKTHI